MIGYLEGRLLKKEPERILLVANQVGYEIMIPGFVQQGLVDKDVGDQLELYIYYHQTERQPKPVLIGFNLEEEKEFFQIFISVEAIGPMKAVKALNMPVSDVAHFIETGDIAALKRLKGIGARTAQKIVASLKGKMGEFTMIKRQEAAAEISALDGDFIQPVFDVLVNQLGHKTNDARQMIDQALARNPHIVTPEALFDEVYKGRLP